MKISLAILLAIFSITGYATETRLQCVVSGSSYDRFRQKNTNEKQISNVKIDVLVEELQKKRIIVSGPKPLDVLATTVDTSTKEYKTTILDRSNANQYYITNKDTSKDTEFFTSIRIDRVTGKIHVHHRESDTADKDGLFTNIEYSGDCVAYKNVNKF